MYNIFGLFFNIFLKESSMPMKIVFFVLFSGFLTGCVVAPPVETVPNCSVPNFGEVIEWSKGAGDKPYETRAANAAVDNGRYSCGTYWGAGSQKGDVRQPPHFNRQPQYYPPTPPTYHPPRYYQYQQRY